MISIITIPKPFKGHIGMIQRNALRSWAHVHPDVQIIVCGDEPGVAGIADALGATWIREVECNSYGTPLVSDALIKADAEARHDVLAYVNSDIVLLSDLVDAAGRIGFDRWLMVGRRTDLDVTDERDPREPGFEAELRADARQRGVLHGDSGMDYFVWTRCRELLDLPRMAVGRPGWDNHFVYRARYILNLPVIDASPSVLAVHQNHDYAHVPGGDGRSYMGPETDAQRRALDTMGYAGIHDATHVLAPTRLVRARDPAYRWARCRRHWLTRAQFRSERLAVRGFGRLRRAVKSVARGVSDAPDSAAKPETCG
jgi:hypothetical protein